MNFHRIRYTIVTLALLQWVPAVHAGDTKILPAGAACQPIFFEFPQQVQTQGNAIVSTELYQPGWGFQSVVCPIVRDFASNTNGTAKVVVRAKSPNKEPLACALVSYAPGGNVIESDFAVTTQATPASLLLDVDAGAVNGFYTLECQLPPDGFIYSYQVIEH